VLPETFGNLISLQELYLSNNQITGLPESIGRLRNLEYFNISNNQLTELPEAIGKLKNLRRISLDGNPLLKNLNSTTKSTIECLKKKNVEIIISP